MEGKIRSLALNQQEDTLIFSTENNQLMRCTKVNLEWPGDETKYNFLIYSFHSWSIKGLDVCIKKQLIATCSEDKTVRIWNYADRKLDIVETYQDQAHSIAFHPSGFHVVVGFSDWVRMMNVF